MILYANGCSHTAASEAVNTFNSAEDDPQYWVMGRVAHPDNREVSFSNHVAKLLKARLILDAENGSSNDRIVRTTVDFLNENKFNEETFILIGWSSWEREEWCLDGKHYQVNSSGPGCVPEKYAKMYKEWVVNLPSNIEKKQLAHHTMIAELHKELVNHNINHLFVNTCNKFNYFPEEHKIDWNGHYLDPYGDLGNNNFVDWALERGFTPTKNNHFGADAHYAWFQFMVPWLTKLL